MLKAVKEWLLSNFEIKDIDKTTYNLGVKIYMNHLRKLLSLSQEPYIKQIHGRFNTTCCKPMDTLIAEKKNF